MTIPEEIVRYIAIREQQRNQAVGAALAALTPREQALVREAAVMGYVRGALAPREEKVPPDSQVVREVIAACLTTPDLYPTIAARGDR